jgi:hypothetical protein
MPAAALLLVILAAAYRVLAAHQPALGNFAPLMALVFCSAAYASDRRWWAAPFLALALSDLYLNAHYAAATGAAWHGGSLAVLVNFAAYGAGLGLGAWVASAGRSWPRLLGGSLAASLSFYFITNTAAWATDPAYGPGLAAWWQALTIGRPEYPPTLWFFRNTLLGDLAFTALFALALEWRARRLGAPSLLATARS